MPHLLTALLALALAALTWPSPGYAGERVHAIAMHGAPRHAPGFKAFPTVNPDAPKGGRLVLGSLGGYDSLNPFIIKGVAPSGIREYVYESLLARSPDEPFTLYGLLAESIEVPEDRGAITFHLDPDARFSDGEAVKPEDVLFSFSVLREHGQPYHRSYYRKVSSADKVGPRSVRFAFDAGGDREIPLIMGLMPILPAHRFTAETFERTSLEPPVGSGPYVIEAVDPGRRLTYRRNAKWWARERAVARGRFNFDEIRVEFFRDSNALFEAFKAGEVDVRVEDEPGRWIEGYAVPAVADGRIVREELAVATPAGLSGLAFNTRRAPLSDVRVRRALVLLFDAEWINRSLYANAYRRSASLFERSELSSVGKSADARERAILARFPDAVSPDILDGTSRLPESDGSGNNRPNMEKALRLLEEAGFRLEGRQLVDSRTGKQLALEFLARTRAQERLVLTYARMLDRLGIALKVRQVDDAQYWSRTNNFDFDMMQWHWGSSLSPGNEQQNRWGSDWANTPNTRNYAGVAVPAADAAIDALIAAHTREDLVSAARALDRVVRSGDYVVPLFHAPAIWVAYWRHLKRPTTTLPLGGLDLESWWAEGGRP